MRIRCAALSCASENHLFCTSKNRQSLLQQKSIFGFSTCSSVKQLSCSINLSKTTMSSANAPVDASCDTAFPFARLYSCALIEPDLRNGGRKHRVYFYSSEEGALNHKASFVNGWLEFLVPNERDYHMNHGYDSEDEQESEPKHGYEVRHDRYSSRFFGTTDDGDLIQAIVEKVEMNKNPSSVKPLFSVTTSF